jgi:hypothetical protein
VGTTHGTWVGVGGAHGWWGPHEKRVDEEESGTWREWKRVEHEESGREWNMKRVDEEESGREWNMKWVEESGTWREWKRVEHEESGRKWHREEDVWMGTTVRKSGLDMVYIYAQRVEEEEWEKVDESRRKWKMKKVEETVK